MAASMEIDSISIADSFANRPSQPNILCCECGIPIDGTTATGAMCADCIGLNNDISQGIPREAALHFCRDCEQWFHPPSAWVAAAPESNELLSICLKKLKGLQKVRVIDARFLWTEPHSRRIKVQLSIQDQVDSHIVQQTFTVVYVVSTQQCPDCAKSYTANVWRACVQVRQKVLHKRTFLYMEQLILKHGAHRETINIKEVKDGVDFFFAQRNQAEKFVDFLTSLIPVRMKKSQQLISEDKHTGSKSYKFTFSVEIAPICKDDLVALPVSLAKQLGNLSPIVLCHRIGTAVCLLDPDTLQTADVPAPVYWRSPFHSLADVRELVQFVVMDVETLDGRRKGRWQLAEVTVARAADLGTNDHTYFCRTHLGGLLRAGDDVMGYMLTGTNFNNAEFEAVEASSTYSSRVPDVVLVKKLLRRRKTNRPRAWKLKRLAKDEGELLPKPADQARADQEYEMFLRDIEEDDELRHTVALYKARNQQQQQQLQQQQQQADVDATSAMDTDDDGDEVPQIPMDELLEDMEDLTIDDKVQ